MLGHFPSPFLVIDSENFNDAFVQHIQFIKIQIAGDPIAKLSHTLFTNYWGWLLITQEGASDAQHDDRGHDATAIPREAARRRRRRGWRPPTDRIGGDEVDERGRDGGRG